MQYDEDYPVIRNPVLCATAGSAVLFGDITPAHYPVYQKNSLLNTNDEFDFGAFVQLGADMAAAEEVCRDPETQQDCGDSSDSDSDEEHCGCTEGCACAFAFAFTEAGIYVFRDSSSAAKETIIAIMAQGATCPPGLVFAPKSYATLLRVGAALRDDISLTPDWTFLLASCVGFLLLILLSALTVSYIYNKNWDQDPARKAVSYQSKQYSKVRRSDIEDSQALVSINSEASSFQFRQQGKTEPDPPKGGLPQGEAEPGKTGKNQEEARTLDLEEIERLKEGLEDQVREIRKLYSKDDVLELSGGEDDGDLNAQILVLRRLLEQNKAVLAGEDVADADVGGLQEGSDDEEERRRRQREQKEAEEAQFAAKQEEEAAELDETANRERDEVVGQVLGDLADRSEGFLDRLKAQGGLGDGDAKNMLEDLRKNHGEAADQMAKALDEDKARQQDLLKRRLEARRRKRAKLQGDLDAVDSKIEDKEAEFAAAHHEIVDRHDKEYQEKCRAYDKEHEEGQQALEDRLTEQKHDKLSMFEERLKEAKKSQDFTRTLDEYEAAQAKVDKELAKQRQKETDDLARLLKNRRSKARSEKELKIQQEVKDLEEKKEGELAELKHRKNQVEGLLEGAAAQGSSEPAMKAASVAGGGHADGGFPDEVSEQLTSLKAQAEADAAALVQRQQKELKDFTAQTERAVAELSRDAQVATEEAK